MEPIPYRKQKKTQVLDLKLSVTYWLFVVLMSPPPSSERFRHVSQTRCPFFFFVFSPFIGSVPSLFLLLRSPSAAYFIVFNKFLFQLASSVSFCHLAFSFYVLQPQPHTWRSFQFQAFFVFFISLFHLCFFLTCHMPL